jgi:hypothetical protein
MSKMSSRSPQSARGSSQDHERFTRGSVPSGTWKAPTKSDEANVGSSKVTSSLNMEEVNSRAAPTRRK